jgi:hypothetical protein
MTRQNISTGTTANDGTGDTLRSAGTKINQNFVELYQTFGTDSNSLGAGITFDISGIVFEGSTNTTTVSVEDPSSDVTITLPDSTGEVVIIRSDNSVNLVDGTGHASKIYYANVFDSANGYGTLPDAHVYHGMFAMNHDTGRAVFAHDGHWHDLIDSDTFTSRANLQLISPKMDTTIFDNTGNFEILQLENVLGSPANYLKISNSISTENIAITTIGDDTNIDLDISAKNEGNINLKNDTIFEKRISYSYQEIDGGTGTATLDSDKALYVFNTTGNKTASMVSGSEIGEVKKFLNRSGPNRTNTITFTSGALLRSNQVELGDPTNASIAMVRDCMFELVWGGDGWYSMLDSDTAYVQIS